MRKAIGAPFASALPAGCKGCAFAPGLKAPPMRLVLPDGSGTGETVPWKRFSQARQVRSSKCADAGGPRRSRTRTISASELDCFPVEAAEGFPLDAIRDHPGDDVLGQALGWDSAEHQAPAFAQRVNAKGPDLVNFRPQSQPKLLIRRRLSDRICRKMVSGADTPRRD